MTGEKGQCEEELRRIVTEKAQEYASEKSACVERVKAVAASVTKQVKAVLDLRLK